MNAPTQSGLTPVAEQIMDVYHQGRRIRDRGPWLRALFVAGAFIVGLGVSYLLPARETAVVTEAKQDVEQKKDVLATKADAAANAQLSLCLAGGEAAKVAEENGACDLAREVKRAVIDAVPAPVTGEQGIPGTAGQPGQSGRGITATAIVDGRFKVTYTDGITEDKGVIKGEKGEKGRSITGSTIANGRLTLTYSDGVKEDLGQVVGKDGTNGQNGTDGKDGAPGRGIAGTSLNGNILIVTYTDGTSQEVGPLPAGPQGPQGIPGQPPMGWTTSNPDGSSTTCQRTSNFDYSNPYYDCTRSATPLIPGG